MFAVIKAGGKQYRVAANDVITVNRLAAEPGDSVAFEALLIGGDEGTQVGLPVVAGATVAGTVVERTRGPKVIAFKKRRRQNSKRKRGHRQELSVVQITAISLPGREPSEVAQAGPAPAEDVEAQAPRSEDSVATERGEQAPTPPAEGAGE